MTRGEILKELLEIKDKKFKTDRYGHRETFLDALLLETYGYCPFSFGFIAKGEYRLGDDEEIEHFRPKKGAYSDMIFEDKFFSKLHHTWSNLFPILSKRNKYKGSQWNDLLLKPDIDNYLEYMIYNPSNGEVQVKIGLSDLQKNRFVVTRNIYKLNDAKLCKMRKTWYLRFMQNPDEIHSFKPLFEN